MSSRRSDFDWELVEREYRAGQLSVREIGRQFGLSAQGILNAAKRKGWSRDLSVQVRQAAKAKLAEHDGSGVEITISASGSANPNRVDTRQVDTVDTVNAHATTGQERDIIEVAAERGKQVVMGHRAGARQGLRLIERLKEDLLMATDRLCDIQASVLEETAEDGTKERRKAMLRAVSLPSRAAVIRDLAQAESKYVLLERQAHNLDAKDEQEETYETRLLRLSRALES